MPARPLALPPVYVCTQTWTPKQFKEFAGREVHWGSNISVPTREGCHRSGYEVSFVVRPEVSFGDPPAPVVGTGYAPRARGGSAWLGEWYDQPAPGNGFVRIDRSTLDPRGYRVHARESSLEGDKVTDRVFDPVLERTLRGTRYGGEEVYARRGVAREHPTGGEKVKVAHGADATPRSRSTRRTPASSRCPRCPRPSPRWRT